MITASISSDKIDKTLVVEKNGKRYLNIVLFENEAKDEYGNHGIIKHVLSREQRAAGAKSPIIGNWRWMDPNKGKQAPAPQNQTPAADADSDTPF